MKKFVLLLVFAVFIFSCSKGKKETAKDKSEKTKSESVAYPDIPDPQNGKGNIAGRILWNGKPAESIEVTMCKDFNFFSGCKGKDYKVNTDKDGFFVIRDAEPGEYSLVVKVFDSKKYLYFTTSIGLSAKKYQVKEDETSKLGEQDIYKLDLKITSPKSESVLKDSKPVLTWDSYPEASYYKITLHPEKGDFIFLNSKIEDTKKQVTDDLVDCKYDLKVEAYNSNDIKIAESNENLKFTVSNNKGTCKINLLSPGNKSTVSPNVTLKWVKHPLAAKYVVYAASSNGGKSSVIVNFTEVSETEFKIEQNLEPGEYNYSVTAKDNSGKKIAESEITFFNVK
jgi:hypothetical protein